MPVDLKVKVDGFLSGGSTGFNVIKSQKLFWGDYLLQGLSLVELHYALSHFKLKVYLPRENEAVGEIIA